MHNGSIHKCTQLVMLTHYSPLRGWLPSVTLGHKHNQTDILCFEGAWEEEGAQNLKWIKQILSELYFPQLRQFRQVTWGLTSVWRQLTSGLTWQLRSRCISYRWISFLFFTKKISQCGPLEEVMWPEELEGLDLLAGLDRDLKLSVYDIVWTSELLIKVLVNIPAHLIGPH